MKLARYGGISLVHAVTPFGFIYLDKLVLKSALGDSQLGLYTAYQTGSFLIVAQLMAIVTNVLFPMASSTENKSTLVRRIRKAQRRGVLPLTLLLFGTVSAALAAFGGEYPYNWKIALLAAAWSSILCCNGILTVVAVTHSERSYLATAILQGVRSIVFIIYLLVLVDNSRLSLTTMFIGLIGLELLDALNIGSVVNRMVLQTHARQEGSA